MLPQPTNLRTRLVLWMVALEALLLLVFGGVLLLIQQNLENQQIAQTLRLSASQLNAVTDVQGGRYLIEPADAVALRSQGVLAWLLTPAGALAATIGDAAVITAPTTLPNFNQLTDVTLANGRDVRLLVTPLQEGANKLGTLVVALPLRASQLRLRQLLSSLGIAVPIVLLLSAVGGYFLANRALAPVRLITETAQQISAADLSQRLALDLPDDEIGRLARTFNRMLARLEDAFQRERQLTSDASHELRTPLAFLKTQLSLARARPRDAETLLAMMAEMEEDVDRMTQLVEQLLTLARVEQRGVNATTPVALVPLLTALVASLTVYARECGVKLRLEPTTAADLQTIGDETRLRQLFANLIENAIKYTPAGGEVVIQVAPRGEQAAVMVRDTGVGIAAEHLPHLFERFYRVDSARTRTSGGVGLGLAIAQAIAQAHQGQLQVQSVVNEGTTFTVILPLQPPE